MKDLRCKLSTCLIILLIIVLCISAAGCAKPPVDPSVSETPTDNTTSLPIPTSSSSPTQASDPPPTSSVPTQPTEPSATEPDPNALTADEIAELQNIYQLVKSETGHRVTNFYNAALGMEYTDPRNISLSYFFSQGDGEEFETTRMTEEEYEFIKSVIPDAEQLDLCRISAQDVERILQMCFGMTLQDMKGHGLESFAYFENTGCYYNCASAPPSHADFIEIAGGSHLEDGNLQIFYTANNGQQYVAKLKPVDGGYHILFNQNLKT